MAPHPLSSQALMHCLLPCRALGFPPPWVSPASRPLPPSLALAPPPAAWHPNKGLLAAADAVGAVHVYDLTATEAPVCGSGFFSGAIGVWNRV